MFHSSGERKESHETMPAGVLDAFSLTNHSRMKEITFRVADERAELYREMARHLGDKIASEKTIEDEQVDVFARARIALNIVRCENLIKHQYDYAYIRRLIDEDKLKGLHMFESTKSFREFLKELGVENVPGNSTIDDTYKRINGEFPNWTFDDTKDPGRVIRRINLAKRFLSAFIKGE